MHKIVLFIMITIPISSALALEDSLEKAVEIAVHGTKFQAARMTVAAENIANESSTAMTPGGDPYRRKIIFAKNNYDKRLKTNVVSVRKYDVDKRPFQLKYDPQHPAADLNGYVKLPNIHNEIERADASEAQRTYEANLGVVEVSRSMIQKTVDAIR